MENIVAALKDRKETLNVDVMDFQKTDFGPSISEYLLPNRDDTLLFDFIATIPDNLWSKAKVGSSATYKPTSRRCDLFHLTPKAQTCQELHHLDSIVFKLFRRAMDLYKTENRVTVHADEGFQILKYHEGDFCNTHVDGEENFSHRKVSGLFYLNDDYEGGEITFPKFNITIKPKKNSILLFPANYAYEHSASEVKKGKKICIVTWFFSSKR